MSITTLEQVKTMLGIEQGNTKKDAAITALIPEVEKDYLAIRNKPFELDDDENIIYPSGAPVTAAKMVMYHLNSGRRTGFSSEKLGDWAAVMEDTIGGYPRNVVSGITRYIGSLRE